MFHFKLITYSVSILTEKSCSLYLILVEIHSFKNNYEFINNFIHEGNFRLCLSANTIKIFMLYTYMGHFTLIEPSKFQNKTMKSSNINALFCHTNTKMPENYNFQILVHCYPIIN